MSDVDDAFEALQTEDRAARVAAIPNEDDNPDHAAKAFELGKITGVPSSGIYADLDSFQRNYNGGLIQDLLTTNHHLMRFAGSHPMAPKVAADDWHNLDAASESFDKLRMPLAPSYTEAEAVEGFANGIGSVLGAAIKGFNTGAGTQRLGTWQFGNMKQEEIDQVLSTFGGRLAAFNVAALGAPVEIPIRTLSGLMLAVPFAFGEALSQLGFDDNVKEQATRELAQMIQALPMHPELIGMGMAKAEAKRLQAEGVADIQRQQVQQLRNTIDATLDAWYLADPYVRAGKQPPVGLHPFIDKLLEDQALRDAKNLDEALAASQKSAVRERAPDLYAGFVRQHTEGKIEISADAVRKLYGEKEPAPEDGLLGWIPDLGDRLRAAEAYGGDIEVSIADWLAKVDKEVADQLHEHIRARPGGVTLAEVEEAKKAGEAKADVIEPEPTLVAEDSAVNAVRKSAALEPLLDKGLPEKKLELKGAERKDKLNPDAQVFDVTDSEGKYISEIQITEEDGGKHLYVNWWGPKYAGGGQLEGVGPNQLGYRQIVGILRQLRQEFPEAKTISGTRTSGVREKAGVVDTSPDVVIRLDKGTAEGDFVDLIQRAAERVQEEKGKWIHFGSGFTARLKGEYTAREAEIVTEVNKVLDRILPGGGYQRVGADQLRIKGKRVAGGFQQYSDEMPLIAWSLESKDPIGTARHEAIHFLRQEGFFTEAQWDTLKSAAIQGKWLDKHGIKERYKGLSASAMLEEGIAEEFRYWRLRPDETHVAGGIFGKLKELLDSIRDAIGNVVGFKPTFEDIFAQVEAGDIGAREPTGPLDKTMYKTPKASEPLAMAEDPLAEQAKQLGMPIAEYRKYHRRIEEQRQADIDKQVAKVEKDIRKRQTDEWKEAEGKMRDKVADEVNARPDNLVDDFLVEGKINGEKVLEKPKLDSEKLSQAQKDILPKGSYGRNGIDPNSVANFFGYQTAEQMINRWSLLESARRRQGMTPEEYRKATIDAETERRMQREHGDLDENILKEAQEHVISDTQLDIADMEMAHFAQLTKEQVPDVKAAAKDIFDISKVTALDYDRILADIGRAGRRVEAALLTKDYATAFRESVRRSVALQVAKLAKGLEKSKEQFERNAKANYKREGMPSVPAQYTNFIQDILLRVGRGVGRSIQDLQEAIAEHPSGEETLEGFVRTRESYGYEIPVADFLLDPNWRKRFEDLTAKEFEAVNNSIKTLIKNGRAERKVIVEGEARDLQAYKDELVDSLQDMTSRPVKEGTKHRQSKLHGIESWHAGLLQIEALFNRFDKGDPNGPWNQLIYSLADAAAYKSQLETKFARQVRQLQGKSAELDEPVPNPLFIDPHSVKDHQGRPIFADPNGQKMAMTRRHLRGVMLYLGREEGREKLARGNGVNIDGIGGVLDWVNQNATKADWEYVQKVWDIYEEMKKLSDQMYRRLSGVAPEKSEPIPIQTPFGTFSGGYAPIRYSQGFEGTSVKLKGPQGLFEEGYTRATTPAGYTKKITGYTAPLSFDIDAIPGHMGGYLHDIAFREAVLEASKIFYDTRVRNNMAKHYGTVYKDLLIPYLKDVANSSVFNSNAESIGRYWSEFFRQNIIGTLIGFNIRTVQKHTATAWINSVTEVGAKNFLTEFFNMMGRSPEAAESNWEFAHNRSAEIQRRHRNYIETLKGAQENVFEEGSWRNVMLHAGAWTVARGDLISAVPTWLAEYKSQIRDGANEGTAISRADRAVRRAHGSTAITNRPEFMRNHAWMSSLYGFFNHMYNRQFELAWMANESWQGIKQGDVTQLKKYQGQLAMGLFSYIILPAAVEELVTPLASDHHDSWGKIAGKALMKEVFATVPIARDVVDFIVSGGVQREPSVGLLTPALKAIIDTTRDWPKGRQAFDRQHAGATVQHALTAFGAMTGLSPKEFANIARFVIDVQNGVARPRSATDWYHGLTRGTLKGEPDAIERISRGLTGERMPHR